MLSHTDGTIIRKITGIKLEPTHCCCDTKAATIFGALLQLHFSTVVNDTGTTHTLC